jgi:hypothetical protein
MANKMHGPILGSFEDIGENIVSQLKQIPKDVGQKALESVGLGSSGGKKGNTAATNLNPQKTPGEQSHLDQLDTLKKDEEKRAIARKALEELLKPPQKKEPSIWEKIQMEEEQKKAQAAEQQKKSAPVQLPSSGARKMPGLKNMVKAKQQGSEIGKNARQD